MNHEEDIMGKQIQIAKLEQDIIITSCYNIDVSNVISHHKWIESKFGTDLIECRSQLALRSGITVNNEVLPSCGYC